jgi:hypothetical protein
MCQERAMNMPTGAPDPPHQILNRPRRNATVSQNRMWALVYHFLLGINQVGNSFVVDFIGICHERQQLVIGGLGICEGVSSFVVGFLGVLVMVSIYRRRQQLWSMASGNYSWLL